MARTDKWRKRWKVQSFTDPGKEYIVAVDRDNKWGCSCPNWRFRRTPVCKHIHFVIGSTDREKAAMLQQQHNIDVLDTAAWKLFVIEDNTTGKVRVGMTRDFGDRE